MAQSREEKTAKKVLTAIDGMGVNPGMVAYLVSMEAVEAQHDWLFEFVAGLIKQWDTSDILDGFYAPTAQAAERKFLSAAMRKAIEREGYTIG